MGEKKKGEQGLVTHARTHASHVRGGQRTPRRSLTEQHLKEGDGVSGIKAGWEGSEGGDR